MQAVQETQATAGTGTNLDSDVTKFSSAAPQVDGFVQPAPPPDFLGTAPNTAQLGDFLRRPVVVEEYTWTDVSGASSFDPWSAYLNNPVVRDKLTNYRHLRGNLHLQIQYNGTPWHYGRAMVSYSPVFESIEVSPSSTVFAPFAHSSLENIQVDPSKNTVGKLVAPFLTPYQWIDLQDPNGAHLGKTYIDILAPLRLANSVTVDSVVITIFAYMTDVQLAHPSNTAIATFVPQARKKKKEVTRAKPDEYESTASTGLISQPASYIAEIAGRLADVPYIGRFAMATEIAGEGIAKIAKIFGWSRPRVLEPATRVIQTGFAQMAPTDQLDNAFTFTIDSKAAVTVDPAVCGDLISEDNLAVKSFTSKWAYFDFADWQETDAVGKQLTEILVTPLYGTNSSVSELQYTPTGFAANMFHNWHGGLQYKFQFVCNRFHRGRIRIQWEPNQGLANSTDTNTAYSRIVDISDGMEYTVTVPWASSQGFLNTGPFGLYSDNSCNGTLSLYVQNPLRSTESVGDIQVLMWMRGAPDIEFVNPQGRDIMFLRPTYPNNLGAEALLEGPSKAEQPEPLELNTKEFEPQSGVGEANVGAMAETGVEEIELFDTDTHDCYSQIYFGDPVRSLRVLAKRYSELCIARSNESAITGQVLGRQIVLPQYPGYYGESTSFGSATDGPTFFNPYNTTPLAYLRTPFAGFKGATRYAVTTSQSQPGFTLGTTIRRAQTFLASRLGLRYSPAAYSADPTQITELTCTETEAIGLEGMQYITSREAASEIQIEVPSYNANRFYVEQGQYTTNTNRNETLPRQATVITTSFIPQDNGGGQALRFMSRISCAAGEDFSVVGWRGIPPMTLTSGLPTGDWYFPVSDTILAPAKW